MRITRLFFRRGGVLFGLAIMGYLCYYFVGLHPVFCMILLGIISAVCVAIWKAKTKKRKLIIGTVWIGILAFLFLNPICLIVIRMGAQIVKSERYMCKPEVYTPTGETLSLYCQSYPLLKSLFKPKYDSVSLNSAWLPERLDGYVIIGQNEACVIMGGGFHHWGYVLSLDKQASSALTNIWQLHMRSEGRPNDRHLWTFCTETTRQFTADEMLSAVIARYDTRIQSKLCEDEWKNIWEGKINTYLLFDRVVEARAACREMLALVPKEWNQWLTLTVALIMAEEESFERAEQMMVQWVKADEKFESYLDLAYFYQLSNKPSKAAEAIRQATKYNANRPDVNADHRGYSAAMYAYTSGEYDTVIQLCNHVMPVRINGDYAKTSLSKLRQAALEAKQYGQARPITFNKGMCPFDPYENVDIVHLLQRPVPKQ